MPTTRSLISTHRMVKAFGALALLAFGAAYTFYAQWFISVCCLFAALLSAVIYLHFALRRGGGFESERIASRFATHASN